MPNLAVKADQTAETNWGPLSEVMRWGTPNRAIQPSTNAAAQQSAVVEWTGIASAQRVDRSRTVRRWE
jgi:hypothetical protein